MTSPFRHVDRDQTIVFGAGALDAAADLIGTGFVLLTTVRAEAVAPSIVARAATVVYVPGGQVDVVAAAVLDDVRTEGYQPDDGPVDRLVALGGGRVIDVAKAVAAAERLDPPIAIPTSLSGAEMTGVHRHARGVPESVPRVRASVVVNDPALSASQPDAELAASSANALGHAITAAISARTTPIAASVAADAIRHLALGWGLEALGHGGIDEALATAALDRDAIALGALLAGWAVDRSGLGPHHALAQTAVRTADLPHAPTNAALLPHTVRAFRARVPELMVPVDAAAGVPIETLADLLLARAGRPGLVALTGNAALLERAVEAAAARGELKRIPPALTADEIRAIYAAAGG